MQELSALFKQSEQINRKGIELLRGLRHDISTQQKSISPTYLDSFIASNSETIREIELVVGNVFEQMKKAFTAQLAIRTLNSKITSLEEHIGSTARLQAVYTRNRELATKLSGFSINIHYENQRNDLLQTAPCPNTAEDWGKFDRGYRKTMLFFNPYLESWRTTETLIRVFFNYASTNLAKDGVVVLMTRGKYEAHKKSKIININHIVQECKFMTVRQLCGKAFADLTGFVHLKNSTSLEKSLFTTTIASKGVQVVSKDIDTIYICKRAGESRAISPDNVVASALMHVLPSSN